MARRLSVRVVLFTLLAAIPVEATPGNLPPRDSDVVARVNGVPIYRKSVREVVRGVLIAQDAQPDPATVSKLADQALDSLIALELLYQESKARGISVSDSAVQQEMKHNKQDFGDPSAFAKLLKARGMTESDLRRDTRKTMAVNRLLEGVVLRDVHVTPEQVKDFYERNKAEFKHPAQIRVSHILIRVPDKASPAQREAAKRQATALLAKLHAGANFADLARTASEDSVSAARGGDLGYIAKGDMDEAFERQAFALSPGQLSGVVLTPYGFEIIKVTGRRDAGYTPLDEIKDRIRAVLLKHERQKRQAQFVAALRKKAKIQILDRAGP